MPLPHFTNSQFPTRIWVSDDQIEKWRIMRIIEERIKKLNRIFGYDKVIEEYFNKNKTSI